MKLFRELKNRKDLMELLVNSMAPSIYGHYDVKKGCLLQLVGGLEKNLISGTRIRGDINLLLIGDPSTAKSQMLRHMLNLSPLSFNTTGRGSSGVGLTAAVTIDKETGEKQLEAGAMVLADRGLICIDEFDKMSPEDRVSMHEVMEQQTVTIAKAGIHVSLNARCSVLAAANPQYGEFLKDRSVTVNIGLPDSLLTRFDLIFIILDDKSSEHDRLIAERVTRNHRFEGPNMFTNFFKQNQDGGVVEEQLQEADQKQEMYEKFNPLIHTDKNQQLLTRNFLKKYLGYVKQKIHPTLRDEIREHITNLWTKLRTKDFEFSKSNGSSRVLPVTVRTLESLIRLSTANAKLRQSTEIDFEDCDAAIGLLNKTLFDDQKAVETIKTSKIENMPTNNRKMEVEKSHAKKSAAKQGLKEEHIMSTQIRLEPVTQRDENLNPQLSSLNSDPTQSFMTQTASVNQTQALTKKPEALDQTKVKKVFRALAELRKENGNGSGFIDYNLFLEKISADIEDPDYIELVLSSLDQQGKISWDKDSKTIMMS